MTTLQIIKNKLFIDGQEYNYSDVIFNKILGELTLKGLKKK